MEAAELPRLKQLKQMKKRPNSRLRNNEYDKLAVISKTTAIALLFSERPPLYGMLLLSAPLNSKSISLIACF
ncbi:hypothetical protein ABDK00_010420 [Niabella insulamsoli]|uniref:hypothetical protein n=1 Tax=Niabella insulamsoli TaxID=3144874 RepID=UPI0031FD81D1